MLIKSLCYEVRYSFLAGEVTLHNQTRDSQLTKLSGPTVLSSVEYYLNPLPIGMTTFSINWRVWWLTAYYRTDALGAKLK